MAQAMVLVERALLSSHLYVYEPYFHRDNQKDQRVEIDSHFPDLLFTGRFGAKPSSSLGPMLPGTHTISGYSLNFLNEMARRTHEYAPNRPVREGARGAAGTARALRQPHPVRPQCPSASPR